jgi:hypothetical protein
VRRRRTEITVETHRVLSIRRRVPRPRSWCEQCCGEVERVTPDEAATLSRVKPRSIYRRLEAGDLHFIEDGSGAVWICLPSL